MKMSLDMKLGSAAQVNVGILAKTQLTISNDDGPVITVNDILIRKGNTGEPFVAYPSVKSNQKDDQGKDKYFPIVKFYDGNLDKFKALSAKIVAKYNALSGANDTPPPAASKPASKAANKPVPAAAIPVASDVDDLEF